MSQDGAGPQAERAPEGHTAGAAGASKAQPRCGAVGARTSGDPGSCSRARLCQHPARQRKRQTCKRDREDKKVLPESLQLRVHLESDRLASGENMSCWGITSRIHSARQAARHVCWGAGKQKPVGTTDPKRRGRSSSSAGLGALGGAGSAGSSPPGLSCPWMFSGLAERYSAFSAARTRQRFASLLLYRVCFESRSKYFHPCIP